MKRNLLLIEHQDTLRLLFNSILSQDFNVCSAKNSIEAFARFKSGFAPDAVLTTQSENATETMKLLMLLQSSGTLSNVPLFVLDNTLDNAAVSTLQGTFRLVGNPSNLVTHIQNCLQDKATQERPNEYKRPKPQEVPAFESLVA